MTDTIIPLICDLLEWLDREPRTHAEVIDGWRTSCPRLPVWEEATDRGFVTRRGTMVEVTAAGLSFLASQRRPAASKPLFRPIKGHPFGQP